MEKFLAPAPLTEVANLPEQWKRYIKTFGQFLRATEKANCDDGVKVALLLRTIGDRGNDIYDSFTYAAGESDQNYANVLAKFESFCKPRTNTVVMRHQLLTLKQGHMSIDEFLTALHKIARDCDLGDMYNALVLQALLLGTESDRLRRRLFEQTEPITLERAIAMCRISEAAAADMRTLKVDEAVHAVNSKVTKKKVHSHKKVKSSSSAGSCGNCGSEHAPRQCKAYGLKCHKCGKYNHFQKCCRSKVRATVHMVGETESQTESD